MAACTEKRLCSDASDDPFRAWCTARVMLIYAEATRASHAAIVPLAAAVIHTRNELILDRGEAGWEPSEAVRRMVAVDQLLLLESDDTNEPTPFEQWPETSKSGRVASATGLAVPVVPLTAAGLSNRIR